MIVLLHSAIEGLSELHRQLYRTSLCTVSTVPKGHGSRSTLNVRWYLYCNEMQLKHSFC